MEDLTTITGRIIPALLVTQLKGLIKSLNESIHPPTHLKITGNKPELINRIVVFITETYQRGDPSAIHQIRQCVAQFRGSSDVTTIATPSVSLQHPQSNSSNNNNNNIGSNSSNSGSGNNAGMYSRVNSGSPSSSSSGGVYASKQTSHHGNMGGQRNQYPSHHLVHSIPPRPNSIGAQSSIPQTFKQSPFYIDHQTIVAPRLCAEAKERTLSVSLQYTVSPILSNQLKKDPELQVMVFCCWADATSSPLLMEFPHVCEIKVNGRVLEANLRGMKNKPGTVSPANITRLFRQETADYNRIEFVYANSTKRYSVSVHTVRRISVESIVAEVERGKFVSKESMLRILEDRNKDDDIQATSSTLSLKCPLGFQRIKIPIRSSYCHHLQCFDAFTFFNLNEQTPTWTCPVCSRVMHSWEEIVVDGYFKDILSNTPSSLESITVQADGSWELSSASSSSQPVAPPSPKMRPTAPAGDSVFIIDEDDDDDDDVSDKVEERRAERTPPPPPKPAKPAIEVIDLISDSEDEAEILPTTMELDGDTYMRDVIDCKADSGTSTSVKTESFEKATPTETGMALASTDVYSIIGSTNESSASASSGTSPVVPMRMTESTQMGPLSPESRMHPTWEAGEDTFASTLLGPRRKRQYDDTHEPDINSVHDTRQRISRLNLHSNGGSDRDSMSAVPSPDVARRSTSSPTPFSTFQYDRRGASEHRGETDDSMRMRRDHMVNRPVSMSFYEGVPHAHGTSTSMSVELAPFNVHYPQQVHQNSGNQGNAHHSSRSATMSPDHHHGYGQEYFANTSRPPSVTSNPVFAFANGGHSSPGTQERPGRWLDQRSNSYAGHPHLNHGDNSRRVSVEERPMSPGQPVVSPTFMTQPSGFHYSHPQQTPSQHQRHHSNDDRANFGRREDYSDGTMHRGFSMNDDDARRTGYGSHPQHVYSPNGGHQSSATSGSSHMMHGVGMPDSLLSGTGEDDGPIFPFGVRGARAR